MALFVLRKLILQTHMRSRPVGLDVWFKVGPFVYFHISCVRTVKALARLRGCAGSPEPSLVAYEISTIISWAGSNNKNMYVPCRLLCSLHAQLHRIIIMIIIIIIITPMIIHLYLFQEDNLFGMSASLNIWSSFTCTKNDLVKTRHIKDLKISIGR